MHREEEPNITMKNDFGVLEVNLMDEKLMGDTIGSVEKITKGGEVGPSCSNG